MAESPNRGKSSSAARSSSSSNSPARNLPENILANLKTFAASAKIKRIAAVMKDHQLYLVGGSVRDLISGEDNVDIDLATSAHPEVVEKLFIAEGIRTVPTGISHGTLTVVIDAENIEITTFRLPGDRNTPGFSDTIQQDLAGRDFTINAIAYDLGSDQLIDPYGGIADILNNQLKAVDDAAVRFKEDPLRILRMVRFGSAYGRVIDPATLSAAKQLTSLLKNISPERIRNELCEILLQKNASAGMQTLKELDAFSIFFPEIIPSIDFEQNEFHMHDVFEHTLWVVDRCPQENLKLRLSALFHDLGKPHTLSIGTDGRRHFYDHESISTEIADAVMHRLKFSNKEIADVKNIVALHMRPIDCGPSGVRRLMRELADNFEEWRMFKYADSPPALGDNDFHVRAEKFDLMVKEEIDRQAAANSNKLAVNGDDLKRLGLPEGREIGEILKQLTEIVIEDPSQNDYDRLISIVKEKINS